MVTGLEQDVPRNIGPYQLIRELGGGGMGRVFLGVSAGGRPVAVKVIRPELAADPEFRSRFGREVAAARKVSGMFTAPVVDSDADGPVPWLATAYVPGPSLAQHVAKHGPLPVGAVRALAAGLAESLAAIHAAGIVHRDLKPSNVLLAPDGPRVIDFGVSRAAEATTLTQTGIVVGSPGFMSPEQARGDEVGPASDVFSLGAVLVFAATGRGPFGEGATPALVYRVVHETPALTQVPEAIRPLAEQCLAKDPGLRPAAADLLLQTRAAQPGPGWLSPDVFDAFEDPGTITAAAPPATPAKTASPPGVPTDATGRRRLASRRSLMITGGIAALLAVSITAALAVGARSTANRHRGTAAAAVAIGTGGASLTTGSATVPSDLAPRSSAAPSAQSVTGTQAGTRTSPVPGQTGTETRTPRPGGSAIAGPTTSGPTPPRSTQPPSGSTPPVAPPPVPVTSTSPSPSPSPTPTVTVTVTVLGGVDLQAWCQSTGYVKVELVESNAYGWKCVASDGTTSGLSVLAACRAQHDDPQSEAYYSDFSNPDSWYCTSS